MNPGSSSQGNEIWERVGGAARSCQIQGILRVSLPVLRARRLGGRRDWAKCGRPGKGASLKLRGLGAGSGGRRCQPQGPDHLSKSALEFPKGSQICLSCSS